MVKVALGNMAEPNHSPLCEVWSRWESPLAIEPVSTVTTALEAPSALGSNRMSASQRWKWASTPWPSTVNSNPSVEWAWSTTHLGAS